MAEETTYDVTVWDFGGDIVKRAREATEKELCEIEDQYGLDEGYTVLAEPND
jgi:hypothetical protein